jgi:hypothetical protein
LLPGTICASLVSTGWLVPEDTGATLVLLKRIKRNAGRLQLIDPYFVLYSTVVLYCTSGAIFVTRTFLCWFVKNWRYARSISEMRHDDAKQTSNKSVPGSHEPFPGHRTCVPVDIQPADINKLSEKCTVSAFMITAKQSSSTSVLPIASPSKDGRVEGV